MNQLAVPRQDDCKATKRKTAQIRKSWQLFLGKRESAASAARTSQQAFIIATALSWKVQCFLDKVEDGCKLIVALHLGEMQLTHV